MIGTREQENTTVNRAKSNAGKGYFGSKNRVGKKPFMAGGGLHLPIHQIVLSFFSSLPSSPLR